MAINKAWSRIWIRDYRETIPANGRVEALNPGPPDYNTSTQNHLYRRQKCFQKCQICSGDLEVSDLTLLQRDDITTSYIKLYAYARTESTRMKHTVNKLENHSFNARSNRYRKSVHQPHWQMFPNLITNCEKSSIGTLSNWATVAHLVRKQVIEGNNKATLRKAKQPEQVQTAKTCNCRNKTDCPLECDCLQKELVYQATVTTSEKEDTYMGLTATEFKTRWRNHQMSFKHEERRNDTNLSKYMWELNEKEKENLQCRRRPSPWKIFHYIESPNGDAEQTQRTCFKLQTPKRVQI